MDATGRHFIDGKDLWLTYGIFVEDGSDDFLQFPERKDSITHDWQDSDGLDIDTSRVFFQSKTITLKCAIVVTTKEEFWSKLLGFAAEMRQPGTRRFTVAELERSFNVIYKDCTSFTRFTRLLDTTIPKIGCKFTLVLTEPEPLQAGGDVFIVDEDGRFLIT